MIEIEYLDGSGAPTFVCIENGFKARTHDDGSMLITDDEENPLWWCSKWVVVRWEKAVTAVDNND